MLKYGITIFIVTTTAICSYFLLAYKLDTIVLYDRTDAYTTIAPYFAAVPEILVKNDNELDVVLSFEGVRESVYLNNLEINIAPGNATPVMPVAVREDGSNCQASCYSALPCKSKMLEPLKQDQHFTFTFNTSKLHTKRYMLTIKGDIVNGGFKSSFRKQIPIQEKAVFLERN
ncbi:hypothetical protein [Chitinophaga pinensis]|uniref:Uncharacterized protein n=1 Tax=Chitinophaga pinensis (strain ATCC 43595 / DSM 2588 / LMG 13176 / NBRC 15968 / NCIMB 11800 / UQM 2034) TaxID=485918 RepID=A0A979GQ91_CHIPD|nr:hypothetical protein [Chitinophaga pinensis]ACU58069.1 hypothetical protein Cpin_0571 [Chitinophaga pinensis DSM 2588]